ncbi:DNA polymerase III subunit gamma/tau [Argonema antarcticum]|uniref:DNA polymerase III subunit gamma/tau n=1 Tax=Argonema antarcticum TaxID=2942763 RepID=UPI002013648E|nr:DNA polymerase III subunit gamma/tau [Argonema antarcticum]MCL1471400.1 DNA polymerase III subunit gamma/tau [Argonema antarcticum A004/B2]
MPYEPLHHKYRPQTFKDLVGQDAIATTLINAIEQEHIAPAYLFTGPRGTGKTSSARILAKSLNCISSKVPTKTPCGICNICQEVAKGSALDVIEIDAASNTGVDNIRELIERAQFAPMQCRYKVYIIDECHMLSTAAFNALLKTLEEPPEQVIFVLATTDPQKVLPTIISRCQRFDFRRIPLDAMVNHLRDIANKENINISDDAITLVAQIAQGGLRDAESTLDQLSLSSGQVTLEKVWDLVGAVPEQDLMSLLIAIADNNSTDVIDISRRLMDRGREPLIVLQNLASLYRDLLIAKSAPNRPDLVAVTQPTWKALCNFNALEINDILAGQKYLKDSEIQIKNTTQPRLWLEVTLLSLLPTLRESIRPPEISNQPTSKPLSTPAINPNVNSTFSSNQSTKAAEKSEPISVHPPVQTENITLNKEDTNPVLDQVPNAPANKPNIDISQPDNVVSNQHEETLDEMSINEIWEKVIFHLDSPMAKPLLRQHGRLLSYKNQQALIGMSTQPLLDAAKKKLPAIEAGFQKAFNCPVKVRLTVGHSIDNQNTSANQLQTPTDRSDTGKSGGSSPKTLASPPATTIAPSPPKVEYQKIVEAPNHPAEITPSPPPITPPVSDTPRGIWEQQDEMTIGDRANVAIAAQHLAYFFDGEIIELREDIKLALSPTKQEQLHLNKSDILAKFETDELEDEEEEDFKF